MKIKKLFRDFSYTIASNFISLAISSMVVLIVPKFIDVEQYGYWQLYIFYTTYVGVLHFGWLDGIYLRYGGANYEDLNKPLFFSQFVQLCSFQFTLATLIILYSFFSESPEKSYIFIMTAVAMILINLRQFCLYVLQDTSRIQEYATVTTIGRVIYFFTVLIMIALGVRNFQLLILADIIGRTVSMLYSFYTCRDIVFRRVRDFSLTIAETFENLSVGIKLVLANFASSLVIGIVRYGIEYQWGVAVFGKVSLTLNISNLLMTFISAIGLVLYPLLRRIDHERLRNVYIAIREILIFVMLVGLIIYYPIDWILPKWLPKYKDALSYMALLFPMCIFSSKFSLLVSTFMKTYRLEKSLLVVNMIALGISFVITALNVLIFKNLELTMVSIVAILCIQSSVGEIILGNHIGLKLGRRLWPEIYMVILFIGMNYFMKNSIALVLYLVVLGVYFMIDKTNIINGKRILLKK